VDEAGFRQAMDEHRTASGGGKAMGIMSGDEVETYREVLEDLQATGKFQTGGVRFDPYTQLEVEAPVAALFKAGTYMEAVEEGDQVEVLLPQTCFYVESGGQVSDTGTIVSTVEPRWEIRVDDMRKPAAGVIVHSGIVVKGSPKVGDMAIAAVDSTRRHDIMRNHTATHLLHAALHEVLGEHARQAGSLVAPDRLRFDFTHPEGLTLEEIGKVEAYVNRTILEGHALNIRVKGLQDAIAEGATALFGEKYGEQVRTISIGTPERFSYELCGGTHVAETNDIGVFLITSEGSAAAGIRRIEAVTGRKAYELIQHRFHALKEAAGLLASPVDEVPDKVQSLLADLDRARRQNQAVRQEMIAQEFTLQLDKAAKTNGSAVLGAVLPHADADTLRLMTDRFRQRYPSGAVVLGSAVEGKPVLIAAVTEDLVKRGLMAGDIVKAAAQLVGGSGGGRPTLAQAGGKDPARLGEAVETIYQVVKDKLK
jgi:alanyl-tRNA synthetase